jgi:LysR family transcriptional regulator, transcriptional activator of nhaA
MNYKHLHYFWTVARSGGIARAGERLHLTPQTVSAQIKLLEDQLGAPLFRPAGRGLELTETGRLALGYADEIFALGDELKSALASHKGAPVLPFRVGITDVMPKSLAYQLLSPTAGLAEPVRLICREGKLDRLLAELALHRLDMVLADRPIPTHINVRGYSHKLGECALAFFAAPDLADACGDFPACLNDAPLLLPGDDATVRTRIEAWLEKNRLAPRVVGEFDDGALMMAFGQAGGGFFPAPAVLAEVIEAQFGVKRVGVVEDIQDVFYAITGERRITHPAVLAVTEAAQGMLSRLMAGAQATAAPSSPAPRRRRTGRSG